MRKEKEKPLRDVTFDGSFEAKLIALACSEAPEGRGRWTVRLLTDKAVELNLMAINKTQHNLMRNRTRVGIATTS